MDLSKLKVTDWLVVVGGLVVVVTGLLDWFDTGAYDVRASAFSFTVTGTIPWIMLLVAGALAVLVAGGILDRRTAPWPFVLVVLTGVATLLILLRLLVGADASEVGRLDGVPDFALPRATPLYLSVLGAALATGGAFLNLQAEAAARAARRRRPRR